MLWSTRQHLSCCLLVALPVLPYPSPKKRVFYSSNYTVHKRTDEHFVVTITRIKYSTSVSLLVRVCIYMCVFFHLCYIWPQRSYITYRVMLHTVLHPNCSQLENGCGVILNRCLVSDRALCGSIIQVGKVSNYQQHISVCMDDETFLQ